MPSRRAPSGHLASTHRSRLKGSTTTPFDMLRINAIQPRRSGWLIAPRAATSTPSRPRPGTLSARRRSASRSLRGCYHPAFRGWMWRDAVDDGSQLSATQVTATSDLRGGAQTGLLRRRACRHDPWRQVGHMDETASMCPAVFWTSRDSVPIALRFPLARCCVGGTAIGRCGPMAARRIDWAARIA